VDEVRTAPKNSIPPTIQTAFALLLLPQPLSLLNS